MGWFSRKETESEWELDNGIKKRISRSVVRKRRDSRRKKWIKRGLAAAAVAYVGYHAYRAHAHQNKRHAPSTPYAPSNPPSALKNNLINVIHPLRETHPIPFHTLHGLLPFLSSHGEDNQRACSLIFGGDGVENLKDEIAVQLAYAITENVMVVQCNTFAGNIKYTVMNFVASKYRQPNVVVLLGIEHLPSLPSSNLKSSRESIPEVGTLETLFEESIVQSRGVVADMTRTYFFMTTNIGGAIHAFTTDEAQRILNSRLAHWLTRPALAGRLGHIVPFV